MTRRLKTTMLAIFALAGASYAQVNQPLAPPPAGQAPQGAGMAAPQGALQDITEPGQWPLQVSSPQGNVTVFQPQLESFQGDHLAARAAVSVDSGQQQTYGAVWFDSRVATDRGSRTVQVMDVNISRSHFPGADPAAGQ